MTKLQNKKIIPAIVGLSMLALGACSSSVGDGSPPPHNTTVVVPPNSSTESTTTTTTTYPY